MSSRHTSPSASHINEEKNTNENMAFVMIAWEDKHIFIKLICSYEKKNMFFCGRGVWKCHPANLLIAWNFEWIFDKYVMVTLVMSHHRMVLVIIHWMYLAHTTL